MTRAEIAPVASQLTLQVEGTTNLVDGVRIGLEVASRGETLKHFQAVVRGGRFLLNRPARGGVVAGDYLLKARFVLIDQPASIQRALRFQPESLTATRQLKVSGGTLLADGGRERLRALFDAVNRVPRDPRVLDDLDRQVRELHDSLWIAEQRAALVKLRLAIEEARSPEFRREAFERLLLEAHVLARL